MGDISISANRSQFVDFTLPFSDNGAAFIVPTRDKNKSNTWNFLQPLTWELWLTTGCFFFYIGFVVWALEHRINEDFRGSRSNQIGTSFWFAFSTLVFAQSNLSCIFYIYLTNASLASQKEIVTDNNLDIESEFYFQNMLLYDMAVVICRGKSSKQRS